MYLDNAYKNYIVYYNYNISVAWHFNVMLLHTQSHIPFIHGYIWDYIVLHNKNRDCSILCMEVLEVCQQNLMPICGMAHSNEGSTIKVTAYNYTTVAYRHTYVTTASHTICTCSV